MFKAVEITSLAFMLVLPPAIIANWNFGTFETFRTNQYALEGLGYIAALAIFGTALAVILFNRIISVTSALFASSVTYFIPIVAVIIGLQFNEAITGGQIASMGVILSGVFLVNLGPQIFTWISKKIRKNGDLEQKIKKPIA
jgi:drug/metabolite transporter (DMT)-like permease